MNTFVKPLFLSEIILVGKNEWNISLSLLGSSMFQNEEESYDYK